MLKKQFSKDFVDLICSPLAGYGLSGEIDLFFKSLENCRFFNGFNSISESNFLRIYHSLLNKPAFIKESAKYPHYLDILTVISNNSIYLTDIITANPGNIFYILNPEYLTPGIIKSNLKNSLDSALSNCKSFSTKVKRLKHFQKIEFLKIAVKDLLGISNLQTTTNELSILANVVLDSLFTLCIAEASQNKKFNLEYSVIALGKTGGSELNYSSDVDLIVIYNDSKPFSDSELQILNNAINNFIKTSSVPDENGFLYRIDFRLRPDGKNAPLSGGLNSCLIYYETRGEHWEKQMLLKASLLSGSISLFNSFYSFISSFIYSFPSDSPLQQINLLRDKVKKEADDFNIKLSHGGIRDIEFSIQALQLLNGKKFPSVKTGNTLTAIEALFSLNIITEFEKVNLTSAYSFFRKIEHLLQLMDNRQTHTIPIAGEQLELLLLNLDFKDKNSFQVSLKSHKNKVIKFYNSVFGIIKSKKTNSAFTNEEEKIWNFLKEGKDSFGLKSFDNNSVNAFSTIESKLKKEVLKTSGSSKTLFNLSKILKNEPLPSIWYYAMADSKLLKAVISICRYSDFLSEEISVNNEAKDFLLTKKIFENSDPAFLSKLSTKKLVIFLGYKFLSGKFGIKQVGKSLSNALSAKVIETFKDLDGLNIFALGSLSSESMLFTSDVDLVFISEQPVSQKLNSIIEKRLKTLSENILPFKVDFRLRPEGRNAQLVWDKTNFIKYIKERAEIWELQSYLKLKCLSGNSETFGNIKKAILEKINLTPPESIRASIKSMREKLLVNSILHTNLKLSSGGYQDIEFIYQFIALSNPAIYSKIQGRSIFNFDKDITHYLSANNDIKTLSENYNFLKTIDFTMQLCFARMNSNFQIAYINEPEFLTLNKFSEPDLLLSKFNNVLKENRILFNKYLG